MLIKDVQREGRDGWGWGKVGRELNQNWIVMDRGRGFEFRKLFLQTTAL